MILPSLLSCWYADAVLNVYEPWLASSRIGASTRRAVLEEINRARHAAHMPPLLVPGTSPAHRRVPKE